MITPPAFVVFDAKTPIARLPNIIPTAARENNIIPSFILPFVYIKILSLLKNIT